MTKAERMMPSRKISALAQSLSRPRPVIQKEENRQTATILLVDDDPSVREGLRRVLHLEGWAVVAAISGEEALEYMRESRPDLLITDLSMVGVNGWDLLFHEKLQWPELPIFVITALPVSSIGGAEKFAHEFFQKPVELDALVEAIHHYIG